MEMNRPAPQIVSQSIRKRQDNGVRAGRLQRSLFKRVDGAGPAPGLANNRIKLLRFLLCLL
jgi:hypothetical protein